MSSKIVETITNFCDGNDLKNAIGTTQGGNTTGQRNALRIVFNNKVYILPTHVMWNRSWDHYNSLGVIYGKEITLNGKKYIARAIKGSELDNCDSNSYIGTQNTEVYQLYAKYYAEIKAIADPQYMLDFPICMKDRTSGGADCLYCTISSTNGAISHVKRYTSYQGTNDHFVLILESLDGLVDAPTTSLGDVYSQTSFNYKAYTTSNMKIQHVINNVVKKTINENGINRIFTIEQSWLDSLSYGVHNLTIRVLDSSNNKLQEYTRKFVKARRTTPALTEKTLQGITNHLTEMNQDLEYQLMLLRDFYKSNGTSIDNTKGLNYLVKNLDIVLFNKRKFAKGTVTSSSSYMYFNYTTGETANLNYMDIVNLGFKPSFIIASYKTPSGENQFITILNSLDYQISTPGVQMLNAKRAASSEYNYNIKADNKIYYSENIIRLPSRETNCTYQWIAFE